MAKFIEIISANTHRKLGEMFNLDRVETVREQISDQHKPPYAVYCYIKFVGNESETPYEFTMEQFREAVTKLEDANTIVASIQLGTTSA